MIKTRQDYIIFFKASQTIWKYLQYPVVIQTSTISLTDIPMIPYIYICPLLLFDYDLAKTYGYQSMSSFLIGNIQGQTSPSWKGNLGNSSYTELRDLFFGMNFSEISVNGAKVEKVFLFHTGYCLNLTGWLLLLIIFLSVLI